MTKLSLKYLLPAAVSGFILYYSLPFSGHQEQTAVYKDFSDSASSGSSKTIAVLGDLQRTSFQEILIGREQNDTEREYLIREIRKENPEILVLLGDLVDDGSSNDSWKYFDDIMRPLKDIPMLPILGNHDYALSHNQYNYRQVWERFRHIENSSWYSRVVDRIALIFLNTNENFMAPENWQEQKHWFSEILRDYDHDPRIKAIIVFGHHPPFTNSIVTGDELNIQKAFVEPFTGSGKTLAFISGHAHTYEHFIIGGKIFLVSGGGGGPRVILKKGTEIHKDICTFKGRRPFHFILIRGGQNSLTFTVKAINKNQNNFFVLDTINHGYTDWISLP